MSKETNYKYKCPRCQMYFEEDTRSKYLRINLVCPEKGCNLAHSEGLCRRKNLIRMATTTEAAERAGLQELENAND